MRVLVACEESQTICIAFREKGHEAYSCDIQDCSGGHPEWHIKGDVLEQLDKGWDLMIAHPPCTYLTISANKWMKEQPERESGVLVGKARALARDQAINFFMCFVNAPIKRIAIENPIGIMSTYYCKPSQVIQPWQFGHGETKATCLWLKYLSRLRSSNIVKGREQRLFSLPPSKNRSKLRSRTFQGIADAMADQWGSGIKRGFFF